MLINWEARKSPLFNYKKILTLVFSWYFNFCLLLLLSSEYYTETTKWLVMDVRTIRLGTEYAATGISLITNTLVLYLNSKESNKILNSYKRMLVTSCIVDYVLCLWSFLTVGVSYLVFPLLKPFLYLIFRILYWRKMSYWFYQTGLTIICLIKCNITCRSFISFWSVQEQQ